MKKQLILLLSITLLLNACGSAKKAEKSVSEGDYDNAFNIAISKLSEDKHKKSNQKLIPTLKEAYNKANDRDKQQLKQLKKDKSIEALKKTYALYVAMDVRQDDVISLQPLYYDGKEVIFNTKNYSKDISSSLKEYSDRLYSVGSQQLAGTKLDARKAFKTFNNLEFVNPNYIANLSSLISQAKLKGSSVVLLKLDNRIQQSIPQEHLDELMRVSESNMKNKWVMYHDKQDYNVHYDYEAKIGLDKVLISPEKMETETVQQEKRVRDGWEYIYDRNGNVMKDSLGNDMKRDKIISVRAEVKLFQQLKSSKVEGVVVIKDLKTYKQISSTPVFGEAQFKNVYAQYRGDQRAIDEKYYEALKKKESEYPKDDEFIKYALAEFRQKMLQLLDQQQF